jgi:rhodanese-related sulfurtransferase
MPLSHRAVRWTLLFALLVPCLLLAGGCSPKIDDSTIRRTTVAEVQALLERHGDRVLLIDSRTPDQVSGGTISGAIPLRPGDIDLNRRDPWLSSHAMLVVFGQNPGSTTGRAVAKRLMMARYSDVRLMEAGLDAWVAKGLKTGAPGTPGKSPGR